MQIPAFLLRKLYVKGSLENTGDGFSFKIKNSLSPGTAVGVTPIKIDDVEYALDVTTIKTADVDIKASEVSEGNSFPIQVGVEVLLEIKGNALSEGEHKIDIGLLTKEAGNLAFDVKDTI
ncbi:MAG: hydroxymethylglutaryl-CoA reductase [Candidatus Thorarchaeota archaeon]